MKMKDLTIATFISNYESFNPDFLEFTYLLKEKLNVEVIVFSDNKIKNCNRDIKQIVEANISKYKRMMHLINIAESNNILCIDNDITLDYVSMQQFTNDFITNDYDLAWGKIKTLESKGFVPKLIKIDKNLSHDFVRPFLWRAKLGISIPGQIFMMNKSSFLYLLPNIDTVYDDLTLGIVARKNNFKYNYTKRFLGSEKPKGKIKNLLQQRIRWSKGMAQSVYNGARCKMLKFVLVHAFMYHLFWIPVYILLGFISRYNLVISVLITGLMSLFLCEFKIKDWLWATIYMIMFPVIHSIWFCSFIYNLLKEKDKWIM
jgi:cellulose synthase/poly-beta-1,6-N-acetylglucosamine synthase-like glycosyltransferase